MDADETMNAMTRVTQALAELSTQDIVEVLGQAWLAWAANARNEFIFVPGGYLAEQERQAAWLEKTAAFVRADAPDLETERLHRSGDTQAILRRYRELQRRGNKGGAG
jgi:DNA-binding helix-hairpin-helix protein with protein kinase domain